jgi:hypothetical protein
MATPLCKFCKNVQERFEMITEVELRIVTYTQDGKEHSHYECPHCLMRYLLTEFDTPKVSVDI